MRAIPEPDEDGPNDAFARAVMHEQRRARACRSFELNPDDVDYVPELDGDVEP
jgi:hypothetical protein